MSIWQCAFVIQRCGGRRSSDAVSRPFAPTSSRYAPFLKDRVEELQDWEPGKVIDWVFWSIVLRKWYRARLVYASAMRRMRCLPVGGVGINLAIQDAVAAANVSGAAAVSSYVSHSHLQKVQWRREFPTKVTRWGQVRVQERITGAGAGQPSKSSRLLVPATVQTVSDLEKNPARLIGIGVRPEHVRTPGDKSTQMTPITLDKQ